MTTKSRNKTLTDIKKELFAFLKDPSFLARESSIIGDKNPEGIREILLQNKALCNKYTTKELINECSFFLCTLDLNVLKNSEKLNTELTHFIYNLNNEKEYEAIIFFRGQTVDIPYGEKIGYIEFIDFDFSLKEVEHYFNMLKEVSKIPNNINFDFFKKQFFAIKIKYINNKTEKFQKDYLFEILKKYYSVFSLISNQNLDIRNTIGLIYSKDKTIQKYYSSAYPAYSESFINYLIPLNELWYFPCIFDCKPFFGLKEKKLIEIISKKNLNDLEKRILKSLQLFELLLKSDIRGIRFIMTIFALESLLIPDNKGNIIMKLSEKIAFLLENTPEKRIELVKKNKRILYKKI